MDAKQVLAMIKEKDVKFLDFRFTDPRGKWQHTARMASATDAGSFSDGVMFDGSSIAGWKAINESDMILMPDPATAVLDPFTAQTTLIINCDVVEPSTGQLYARCPRSTAKRAEAYMKSSGIGDTAVFGPELEFFVFDDVRFDVQMQGSFFKLHSSEAPWNTGAEFEGGNMGHRPGIKGGYFPVQPVDSMNDLRAEMMSVATEMGLTMEIHHHEVAPSQNELGFRFDTLVKTADNVQKYKYSLHNVAHSYGKKVHYHRAQGRAQLWQDAALHAEAAVRRQRLGHAHPPVDLEGQQAAVRRIRLCRSLRDGALLHRRHHQARQGAERLLQRQHQLLQARHPGLRGAGAAGLFLAQPLGVVPHPLRVLAQGQARRGPPPRPVGQPLPRLRGDADGRPRRHPEQDPSGRPDGQEPLRPAAGGAVEGPCRRRLAARGTELPRRRPHLPDQGRRVHRRPDRRLHGAQVGRGLRLGAPAGPGRVQDVLLGLSVLRTREGPACGPFFFAQPSRSR